jgi:DNA primase
MRDRTPSLQLYEDGSFYCFGCDRGGTMYDFAAELWSTGTTRREFLELRVRLADELAIGARA